MAVPELPYDFPRSRLRIETLGEQSVTSMSVMARASIAMMVV
jgi:hypothetical protein